ncbi:MAG TPA: hypothetical protein VLC48_01005 [Gemmatimonadota bacterium]|nr:hypothetical protein [Gemmatimonadota bacterium]
MIIPLPLPRLASLIVLLIATSPVRAQDPGVPPIPMDVPVLLVGDPRIDGSSLQPYEGAWAVGTIGKDEVLAFGEEITPGGISLQRLERAELDGRPVWRRTLVRKQAGSDVELMTAIIYMEIATLRPIRAMAEQPGGSRIGYDYDWDAYVVRPLGSGDETPPLMTLDLAMLESGAHDVWMAALPYEEGSAAKIPVLQASTQSKHWVVARVVGSEVVDRGDGIELDAWVVELDWWGMGADPSYFPGGGRNGTAGTGGVYWIFKDPPPGVSRVFRVRTEINQNADVIVQMQGGN